MSTEATPRPWELYGCFVIWSPTGHACVAAVSEPRPEHSTTVGYYPVKSWGGEQFEEACANAKLIVTAVNSFDTMRDALREIAKGPEHGGYAVDAIRGLMEIAQKALAAIDGKDS